MVDVGIGQLAEKTCAVLAAIITEVFCQAASNGPVCLLVVAPQIREANTTAQESAPATGAFKNHQVLIADLPLPDKHRRILPQSAQRSVQASSCPRGATLEIRSTDVDYFQ